MTLISWAPYVAVMPTDPAQRAGYIFGMALGIFMALAIVVAGIVSIVMAFVKRTTGWIIAGAISGFLVLALGGMILVGFAYGFTKGFTNARQQALAKAAPETLTGKTVAYTIEKPAGWTVKRDMGSYDAVVANGVGYVGVIAEGMDVGSNETVAKFARQRFESIGADLTLGNNQPASLDGRQWISFTAKCKVQNIPFTYQTYVYSGKEGTIQVMTWSFQNQWDRQAPELGKVVQTFHFPATAAKP